MERRRGTEGTIVVTGASRGIGAAIAVALAEEGFDLACLSRSGKAPVGRGLACDMTDEAAIVAAIAEFAAAGPLVGLVNNAGQYNQARSADLVVRDFEALMRINATSVVVASREAYPHLKAAGGGLIVNIGSFFDKLGTAEHVAYCASKAAVGAITRCLATEWAADGISVLNVAPGYITTDLNRDFLEQEKAQRWLARRIPVGRPGTAEEVAKVVRALFAADVGFLTGETIYLDGGQGMNH